MIWPLQARDPAPKEKCWIPVVGISEGREVEGEIGDKGDVGESQRSGVNVEAEGPKWSMSVDVLVGYYRI
jgi:hypothetical protein